MTKEEIIKEKKFEKKLLIIAIIGVVVSIINAVIEILSRGNWLVIILLLFTAICFLITGILSYKNYKKL